MAALFTLLLAATAVAAPLTTGNHTSAKDKFLVSLGPRPYFIINNMTDSPLRRKLQSCENQQPSITGFTVGHRGGGTLQFPEETVQSENAGARMGAG